MNWITNKSAAVMMSILLIGVAASFAEADEPGPFERLFRAMRHGFNESHHKSTKHKGNQKHFDEDGNPPPDESSSVAPNNGAGVNKPPNSKNTRNATKAATKKGEDLRYGTPVPGKQGFVTSPFSPNSGYIDVRGFAPGTPVKDPYTGKIFLTP
ncbi:MAG TPA: hypothetical protein VH170_02415 [Chthoniobacterales bacterium]|jgi:hypothetical protein|nr:hypothetical protein [Chthoniobacterales bacterium]